MSKSYKEMNEHEKMLAGLPYHAYRDGLPEMRMACKIRLRQFNTCPPEDLKEQDRLIREIMGSVGEHIEIFPPFYCDYGKNIHIGDGFFASYNCTMVDCGPIIIGDDTMIAANVTITAAGHPIHPEPRTQGYEYGIETVIGSRVWIGANVVVNPGVHIGDDVVIGSGSVVTKDIPSGVVAAGNPCRVLREVTEEDKKYYFKKRTFPKGSYMG